jgi:hypothetical protein
MKLLEKNILRHSPYGLLLLTYCSCGKQEQQPPNIVINVAATYPDEFSRLESSQRMENTKNPET